ncbi:hypothetical protein PC128_g12933 [Phytophthora cactorum]|nr:hypothetical protein PC128_g12933 [Phytophthora cactorum]
MGDAIELGELNEGAQASEQEARLHNSRPLPNCDILKIKTTATTLHVEAAATIAWVPIWQSAAVINDILPVSL